MDVGIRELKQHLSEYLDRAARGETIRVTDRGQAKAILGPLPGALSLSMGIEKGWIKPPSSQEPPAEIPRMKGQKQTSEVLNEDRGE